MFSISSAYFHSSCVSKNIYTNRGIWSATKYNFTRFNASREIFVEPNRARRPSDIAMSDTKSSITSLLVGVIRHRMAWFPSNGAYKDHPYRYLNVWRLLQCKRTYSIPHVTMQKWDYASCHVISQTQIWHKKLDNFTSSGSYTAPNGLISF